MVYEVHYNIDGIKRWATVHATGLVDAIDRIKRIAPDRLVLIDAVFSGGGVELIEALIDE